MIIFFTILAPIQPLPSLVYTIASHDTISGFPTKSLSLRLAPGVVLSPFIFKENTTFL